MMNRVMHHLNLDSDLEHFDKIHNAIEQGINFKGTNLWILVFAIIIASVGLNMNSTAVIIGAMLISPLMGPINGMGYSIATYNMQLFRTSAKNFSFAVAASLVTSTVYFALSPVSVAHSEILARTSPTIYDVLIALFGGLAGIIAISSKLKGNVIPGVAIATALMPPLCTAGYGLGTGQYNYFFGAFYLFTINTVFIAISSVIISQVLNFPIRTLISESQKARINRWITAVTIATLIPSIYFGYGLAQKEKFQQHATLFVGSINIVAGNYLLKNEIDPAHNRITLVYGGNSLTEEHKKTIRGRLKDFSIEDAEVTILQGFSFSEALGKTTELDNLKGQNNQLLAALNENKKQLDSIKTRTSLGQQLLAELRVLYPQVTACTYAESFEYGGTDQPETVAIVLVAYEGRLLKKSDEATITRWLTARVHAGRIRTYFDRL